MASGSFSNYIIQSNAYSLRVDWTSTPDINTNSSSVTCKMYLDQGWSLYIPSRSDNTCVVNGQTYTFASPAISKSSGTTLLGTVTNPTVSHNNDGTKTCTITATFYIRFTRDSTGVYYEKIVASSTVNLDTIARTSDVTLSNVSPDIGSAITINIDRKVSTFEHYVYAKWAAKTIQIGTNVDTSVSWTLPMSMCEDIQTAPPERTGTIYVETYNGSILIGTKTVGFTGKVPADVVPTISAVDVAEATTGIASKFNAYVQNKSTLAVSVTAAGVYGSAITKYETYIQAAKYTGSSFTSGIITASGAIEVATTVTDSRGRTATFSQSITVLAYNPPVINSMSAWRIDPSGTANDEGERIAMSMNFAISPVGNLNDGTYTFKYKASGDADFTTFGSGAASWLYNDTQYFTTSPVISANNAYIIQLEVSDYFQTATYAVEIPTAYTIMDFRNTGKGIAIGKVSEKDSLEVAMNADFTGQVKIYSPASDVADSGFLRLYRDDGTLCAFFATSDGGNGLNLHFYSGGVWSGIVKFTADGAIIAKNLSYGTATTT